MASATPKKVHIGNGVFKPGARPIKVVVDAAGEWWICDADVDPHSKDFKENGCSTYGDIHMAEGG